MTHLPADTTRCSGNERDEPYRECPVRQACARYRDLLPTHLPADQPVPCMDAPKGCEMHILYTEPDYE